MRGDVSRPPAPGLAGRVPQQQGLRLTVNSFGKHLWGAFVIVILIASSHGYGQLVQIGPTYPHSCEKVKVDPNLSLETSADVKGVVQDPSGVAMIHTRIEVRRYLSALKQSAFKQALTDGDGKFSIGVLPAGRYRLVILAPGFRQPRAARCAREKACDLKIMPEIAPTDTFPESVCPPK